MQTRASVTACAAVVPAVLLQWSCTAWPMKLATSYTSSVREQWAASCARSCVVGGLF